jgi:hypothetical protein
MNDRKTSISIHDIFGPIGADTAAIAAGVRRATDVEHKLADPLLDQVERSPLNPPRESSAVVYCGDAQQVSEGFAIALRAMGVVASIQNREGN